MDRRRFQNAKEEGSAVKKWLEELFADKRSVEFVDLDSEIVRERVAGSAYSLKQPGLDAAVDSKIAPESYMEFLLISNGAQLFIPSAAEFPNAQFPAIYFFSAEEIQEHSTWLSDAMSSNRRLSPGDWAEASESEREESEFLAKELSVVGFWGAPGDIIVATREVDGDWAVGVIFASDYEAGGPITSFHVSSKAGSLREFLINVVSDWPKNLPATYRLCDENGRQFAAR